MSKIAGGPSRRNLLLSTSIVSASLLMAGMCVPVAALP